MRPASKSVNSCCILGSRFYTHMVRTHNSEDHNTTQYILHTLQYKVTIKPTCSLPADNATAYIVLRTATVLHSPTHKTWIKQPNRVGGATSLIKHIHQMMFLNYIRIPHTAIPQQRPTQTHLAPLAVLEQDGRVHLLHGVIEALQGRLYHGGHKDVGMQVVRSDGDGTETEEHQPTLSLQIHLWQRAAVHLHDLHVLRQLHARTQHAAVAVVQEGVELLGVVDVAHRAITGRVTKVVADGGHQVIFTRVTGHASGGTSQVLCYCSRHVICCVGDQSVPPTARAVAVSCIHVGTAHGGNFA